jgi:hypothetical protein
MGIFKSLDGGVSWESKSFGLVAADHPFADNLRIRSLAMSPHDSRSLIVGVWGGSGVLETDSGGDAWQVTGGSSLSDRIRVVAYNPAVPGLIYAGRVSGGAAHNQQGTNSKWRPFPDQAQGGWASFSIVTAIEVNPIDGNTIFMGVYGLGILRSTDGGTSWSAANTGFSATSVTSLVSVPSRPLTLYAATDGAGVFRSTDGGVSWSLHDWAGAWDWARGMAIDPVDPDVMYITAQGNGFSAIDLRSDEMLLGRPVVIP